MVNHDAPNEWQEPDATQPVSVIHGDTRDVLRRIPSETFQMAITSPPYWGVRDYGYAGQIGAEERLEDYIATLTAVFREVRRVLKNDGLFWLNTANCYTSGGRKWRDSDAKNKGRAMSYRPDTPEGLKPKDLIGIPWLLAFALQRDGWFLRSDIIWHKPNCQPESVRDRVTVAHEYLFMFSKSEHYTFYQSAIVEQTADGKGQKNKRSVWAINTEPFAEAHYAVFPKALVRPCVLASTQPGELVFDPFFGSGTVGEVASELGRRCVGVELKPDFVEIAKRRVRKAQPELAGMA